MTVPNENYYGIQILRGLENFPITGTPISSYHIFIKALALVKKSAAMANKELRQLDSKLADPIDKACNGILTGDLFNDFCCDVLAALLLGADVEVEAVFQL
ncbi:MAG: hypothetical protein GY857_03735 [Desulfobacula sp.]|nr:hypothetical protein [Desulfobacula sp.]